MFCFWKFFCYFLSVKKAQRLVGSWLIFTAGLFFFFSPALWARPNFNISSISFTSVAGTRGCWGYVDSATQKEFALICAGTSLKIYDVTGALTNAAVPGLPLSIPATGGELKQVRPYSHYLFAVNQSGVGLQVIDVGQITINPSAVSTVANYATLSGAGGAHTVHIDGHYAYLGMNGNSPASWRIIDISNPLVPVQVGQYQTPNGGFNDSHDSYVKGDTAYVAFLGGGFSILNIANPAAPVALSNLFYPGAFTHNCWTTGDGKYLFTTDEVTNGTIKIWNVQNPASPTQVGHWSAGVPGSDVHNVQVQGDFLYAAYYGEGVEILDIEDPTDPIEVGHFDTDSARSGFAGCWDFFNFFPSGTLVASNYYGSTNPGMWLLKFNGAKAARIRGTVRNQADSTPLPGVTVRFLDVSRQVATDSAGDYITRSEGGTRTLEFSLAGFLPETVVVNAVLGDTLTLNVNLNPTCAAAKGDVDANGILSGADVIQLLNCVFLGTGGCQLCLADLNCDGILTASDVILELNHVFLATPLPCL